MVVHKVTWLHEIAFTIAGQPAIYHELSIALFGSGYLAVMDLERLSLRPLMASQLQKPIANAELYGWKPV